VPSLEPHFVTTRPACCSSGPARSRTEAGGSRNERSRP
jgi:hypothetical protein